MAASRPKKEAQWPQEFMPTSDSDDSKSRKTDNTSSEGDRQDEAPKPSKLSRLWAKTDLDLLTLKLMFKAAVPPTIALSMFQSPVIASHYLTLGYLIAISSYLAFCIAPRAKFIQTMIFNIISICLAQALALFGIWTAIQARSNTTPTSSPPYDSSAAAVCGVWLFFLVYLSNSIRSARPQMKFPTIVFSIFVNVALTFGPQIPDTAAATQLTTMLIKSFLTGFALATGVSFIIFPQTQRAIWFGEYKGAILSLRRVLKAQLEYTRGLENADMFNDEHHNGETMEKVYIPSEHKSTAFTKEELELRAAVRGAKALHTKLAQDLSFAKREFAYGKIPAEDLPKLFTLFRKVFLPLSSIATLIDVFKRVAHRHGWNKPSDQSDPVRNKFVMEWQTAMKLLHSPFAETTVAIDKAFDHILLRLELIKPPKKSLAAKDEESKADGTPQPGSDGFADWLEQEIQVFLKSRELTLREWCQAKGIQLPRNSFDTNANWMKDESWDVNDETPSSQRQLFVLLYIEFLMVAAARSALGLVRFTDEKVADGTMSKNRIIEPGYRRLKKWAIRAFAADEDANESSFTAAIDGAKTIYLGEAFGARKDPEHLPPENRTQRIGNAFRNIPRMLKSPHSAFGFRAACATMCIAIVALLRDSYVFFVEQRLIWALIMISISMARTSGQSIFVFVLRVFGTTCAVVASFLIYYIPDGTTAGVLVFEFIWLFCAFYIVLKMPRYIVVGMISSLTSILIIGYELQVRVLGVAISESSGQPYIPIYLVAPYRLANVAGGLAVAWFWTMFPYPITEHSEMRKDLGGSLYLVANFYAVVHEAMGGRVRNDIGDENDKSSPASQLREAGEKVFVKSLMVLERIRTYSNFSKFELSIGGRFPRETYDSINDLVQGILGYTALMSYASRSFNIDTAAGEEWMDDFRTLFTNVATTSHDVTTRLCLLSSALSDGHPLPPYLVDLQPYLLAQRLEKIDHDILSIRHIAEPAYAAFSVIQICSRSIIADLNILTAQIKELVGELDFSFYHGNGVALSASSTQDSSYSVQKGKSE